VKKPLMTKVSMRHLNEIVRERNQYSRDTAEAWQDYINLKGRMDMEVSKINKRNNFLVEELESWKQQFLKFQAFVEQLTKETTELKVKIEAHKRENRRLVLAIDQQKDDAARLTVRLAGTEKQRDDALEALVLQQEIAEELERERKRNKKELANLQSTNKNVIRQREEAQRVVVHLRSLISGQTHHMEHIVRSLHTTPEIADYVKEDFDDASEEQHSPTTPGDRAGTPSLLSQNTLSGMHRLSRRSNRMSTPSTGFEVEKAEGSPTEKSSKRISQFDIADRHLRDKTEAIAHIIRSISDQCAAAVEGLQLAHNAENEAEQADSASQSGGNRNSHRHSMREERRRRATRHTHGSGSVTTTTASISATSETTSENGRDNDDSSSVVTDNKHSSLRSSIPPTPDLVHRASTAMSMTTISTATDRQSLGQGYASHNNAMLNTKIVEDNGRDESERGSEVGAAQDAGAVEKTTLPPLGMSLVQAIASRVVG
jgi:hypothetical protein